MGVMARNLRETSQAISSYAMQYFRLLFTWCHNLESMRANFWWGSKEGKRKTHWVLWSRLCLSKEEGGLWFRSLVHMNSTLLAKQAWILVEDPESTLAKAYKARYFPDTGFWDASIGYSPSFTWRSILQSREVLRRGCRWILGDENTIRIWQDTWVQGESVEKLISPAMLGFEHAQVVVLMDIEGKRWDVDVVRSLLLPCETELVFKMPFPTLDYPDRAI
ncbi:hypothetical protein LIER_43543 [Lithospermum erythrorhizon]|uniref:Uncharacterized protein n=1 Tax=Lithospermum erythrorhizon TaxID=34254 RepID=A0AAV3QBC4_LITER